MTFFSRFLRSMYYYQKHNSTYINLIFAIPVFFIHVPAEVFNWNFLKVQTDIESPKVDI